MEHQAKRCQTVRVGHATPPALAWQTALTQQEVVLHQGVSDLLYRLGSRAATRATTADVRHPGRRQVPVAHREQTDQPSGRRWSRAFPIPTSFFPFEEGFTPPQLLNMNTTLLSPLMLIGRSPDPLRVLIFHTQALDEFVFHMCFSNPIVPRA